MMRFGMILCAALMLAASPAALAAEPHQTGRVTKRPLPRFESLKFDEARLRVGPGRDYRTLWIYQRAGLPFQVIDEYDTWLRVRDFEGAEGWISANQLGRRRMALGLAAFDLRMEEAQESAPLAHVEPGAPLRLLACGKTACRLEAQGLEGWADKALLWGVAAEEAF